MSFSLKQLQRSLIFLVLKVLVFTGIAVFSMYYLYQHQNNLGLYLLSVLMVAMGLAIVIFLFIRRYLRGVKDQLRSLIVLEHWAEQAKVSETYPNLPKNEHLLTQTIVDLLKKLARANQVESHFDMKVRGSALLDAQTGVGNREYFNSRLEALLKEEEMQGVLYFIHFNHFDVIHSLYGERQVNTLLTTLVSTIKHRLKTFANSYVARRSESEIALVIPGIFIVEAEKLATKLIHSFSTVPLPVGVNHEEFVHIGMSYFSHAESAYQIKSEADMALRSAQLLGPSQWFMYEPGEVEHVCAKGSLQWRTFLERAIANNAFVLFFQPVIAKDGEVTLHHEVLSKVRDVDGSLISARVFLPMAKKCGLANTIDLLVLEQVCRLLSYDNSQQAYCSLNISIESLLTKDFTAQVLHVLTEHQIQAAQLIIEISEYHLVNHLDELMPVLNNLNQMGIKLLVDKVGQYIESSHYLMRCPISFIKLHRSIVLNIHKKPENQIFVQSLKTLCATNNVEVYALGVECNEEWQVLMRIGVNGGQGHYFTEPVAQVAKAIHLP
ncbi:EAL domain-containing protein [Thalassotalea sp. G2M2-11]|uniref:EAL domain-containing protein n=1 Tax=Thalassotalea sp. G2M2-11 TaxID=2787627 RepID=UPI0019D250D8|nr:EAL domain-containing protein [Thalassotalea sp. G2M2-11]